MVTDGSTFAWSFTINPEGQLRRSSSPRRRRPRRGRAFGSSQPADLFGVHTFRVGDIRHHTGRFQLLVVEQSHIGWGDRAEPEHETRPHLYRLCSGPADQASSWQPTHLDTLGITEEGTSATSTGTGGRLRRGTCQQDPGRRLGGIGVWLNTPRRRGAAVQSTGPPLVSGTAEVGRTLTSTTGTWSGATSYAYQWLRCTTPRRLLRHDRRCDSLDLRARLARTRAPRSGRA